MMVDSGKMVGLFVCFVFSWLLSGCQTTLSGGLERVPIALVPQDCKESGMIESGKFEQTSRGYSYTFVVYLPPCYATETGQYPVLYLLPGRGSGPAAWFDAHAAQVADDLILSRKVPPFLIVATENPENDPHSEVFLTDLLPYIESHYRVLTSREYRVVGGASLGGIGAYRLVFQHPDQFASVGLFGSGLVHGEETQFEEWLQALSKKSTLRVFLNCGEGDPLMLERAEVMRTLLNEAGIETTVVVSPGDHSYAYWVSNLPTFFEWMARGWE